MKLSTKEQQIFDLNTLCLSREELCKRLKITKATLNTHMNNIASKLVMPEQMNIQYFLACLKLKELQKRQSELESLRQYKAFIEDENRRSTLDKLNTLTYEKNLINNELLALNEELELIIFQQSELQKRESQLYKRLSIVEDELQKNSTGV